METLPPKEFLELKTTWSVRSFLRSLIKPAKPVEVVNFVDGNVKIYLCKQPYNDFPQGPMDYIGVAKEVVVDNGQQGVANCETKAVNLLTIILV